MAPKLSRNPGRTAKFYRNNPEAREKHRAAQREINKSPEKRKYRSMLIKERRKRGIYGKGGGDISHQPDGSMKIESRKANRARGGSQRK